MLVKWPLPHEAHTMPNTSDGFLDVDASWCKFLKPFRLFQAAISLSLSLSDYQIIKYQIINHIPKKNERPKIPVVHGGGVRSESLVTILFLGVSEWVRIEIQWGRRTAPHRFNFWISNERLWKCSHPEPAWASCSWVKDNVKCQSTFNLQVSTISLSQSPSTKLVSITTSHA